MASVVPQKQSPGVTKKNLRTDDGRLLRGRRSREKVRQAANALFQEKGFDQATLRAIAERAGMGASSIYRHYRSKEEMLILELAAMQEEAWTRFRTEDQRNDPTKIRLQRFFAKQHNLLVENSDFTKIAVRAQTREDRVIVRRALALQQRTIGLIAEILQHGKARDEISSATDPLNAASVLFHATQGVRIAWASGLLSDVACQKHIDDALTLVMSGVSAG